MAEYNLGQIIQQVQAFRQLDTIVRQTEADFRATVATHTKGLLAICNQPGVGAVVVPNPLNPTFICFVSHEQYSDHELDAKWAQMEQLLGRSYAPLGAELQIANVLNHGVFFALAVGKERRNAEVSPTLAAYEAYYEKLYGPLPPSPLPTQDQRMADAYRKRRFFYEVFAPSLSRRLNLRPNPQWAEVLDHDGGFYFGLPLTPDDFVIHPDWLEALDTAVTSRLQEAQQQAQIIAHGQQARIAQFKTVPLADLIEQLRENPNAFTQSQLLEVTQDAAETIVQDPTLQNALAGVSEERVQQIVSTMLDQRLGALQASPDGKMVSTISSRDEQRISQAAKGNAVVESMFRRFVRRSKDPERATQALVALTGLIPGAQQLQAIIQALNVYFGPEETTR